MGEVDPAFFQDLEHRPNLSASQAEGIPLIDLSPEGGEGEDGEAVRRRVVAEIGEACRKWGFFQVVNHGVPEGKRERAERESRWWFTEQTLEEKKEVRRDEKRALGYYDTEHTKNVRDWKEVFDFAVVEPLLMPASFDNDDGAVAEWLNQWPLHPPEFRQALEEYVQEVEKLSHKLMGLIALSLGLREDRFEEFFKDQSTFVRLNHYPPCPVPHLALGVGRHKDAGALTILTQDDVGGLQVKRKSDGEWVLVQPTPNAFIINVGDIIQVWSNGAYESVEHRVMVNSEKDRFSIPFFFNPSHYVIVEPLQELTDDQNPHKYKPYSWGKFLLTRRRGDFMKLDVENIQIDHFHIPNPKSQLQN